MKRLLFILIMGGCSADCSDMKLRLLEDGSEPSRDQRVGVGLALYVDVWVHKSGFPVNPENLAVIADVPDTVDINIGAIPHDRSGQPGTLGSNGKAVGLTPLVPGDNGFVFIADNTDETVGLSYEAMPVTEVRYLDGAGEPIKNGSSYFNGVLQFELYMQFMSDDRRVAGTTPLDVAVPADVGFGYVKNPYAYQPEDLQYYFDLGDKPYVATFSTAVAPQTLTLNVLDATGIAKLGMQLPVGMTQPTLQQGRVERFQLVPYDATNQPIIGRCADPATATVAGTSAMVRTIFNDGEVVLEGIEPGVSTITFTWGTATLDVMVNVTAPPM